MMVLVETTLPIDGGIVDEIVAAGKLVTLEHLCALMRDRTIYAWLTLQPAGRAG